MKRPAQPSDEDLATTRSELWKLIAAVWDKSIDEVKSAWEAASPEATIMDLGLTSNIAIQLKGRVTREMEAEREASTER